MEIMEILKDAFVFPSKDLTKFVLYIVFVILASLLGIGGCVLLVVGMVDNAILSVLGIILLIAGLIVGFIISGYQVTVIKTGIDRAESAPDFMWKENCITGVKYLILNIVYFIIPAIIVLLVAWATNLFGNAAEIFTKMFDANMQAAMIGATSTAIEVTDVVPQSLLTGLGNAMIITGVVATILFIIFLFIQTMAESRLANTDSLGEALNIPEAFRDIGRIGWGKVIATVILIVVIIGVINLIISFITGYINVFGIISIIVTPYLILFAARATGLLYSEIA